MDQPTNPPTLPTLLKVFRVTAGEILDVVETGVGARLCKACNGYPVPDLVCTTNCTLTNAARSGRAPAPTQVHAHASSSRRGADGEEVEAVRISGSDCSAVAKLEAGVAMQDTFSYFEPAYWPHSLRACLGAELMRAARYVRGAFLPLFCLCLFLLLPLRC